MPTENLQQFFPVAQFGDTKDVVPLTIGQSGASVSSVTTDTGAYILRIHGQDRESWEKVLLTQEVASKHGIAPAIIHIDHVERAVVSVRVSGVSLGAAVSMPETRVAALRSLIEVLTKLHAIPASPFGDADPIGFLRSVWDDQVQRMVFPSGRDRWEVALQNGTNS